MSLSDEIQPYIDSFDLVSPGRISGDTLRGSDNGPLFTSQYIILCHLNSEYVDTVQVVAIQKCIDSNSYLHRDPTDSNPDAPDDHYGVLSCTNFTNSGGFMKVKLPLTCYQPALLYLQGLMNYPRITKLFSLLIAIIIATSNLWEEKGNTSNKLLTWTLIKGVQEKSYLCRIAGKIWTHRMRKIYGSTQEVAKIYFGADHPFVKYWKE